jgi:hypothetical protein
VYEDRGITADLAAVIGNPLSGEKKKRHIR